MGGYKAKVTGLGARFCEPMIRRLFMTGTRNILASPAPTAVFLFLGKRNAHTLQSPSFRSLLNIFLCLSPPCSISKWMISTLFWKGYRPRVSLSIPCARITTTGDLDGLRTQKETESSFGSRRHKVTLTRFRLRAFWRGETGQRIMVGCLVAKIARRGVPP